MDVVINEENSMYELIYNGNIISMDSMGMIYNWLLIEDGKIKDAGCYRGYEKYFKDSGGNLDLEGKTVLPGFIDSHVNLVQTGFNKMAVDLSKATTIYEVIELLKERADMTPRGQLISGVKIDELNLKGKKLPDRYVLDKHFKNHPVWISRVEKHTSIINTYAYRLLNIPFNLVGIECNRGIPTGILTNRANSFVFNRFYSQISESDRERGVELTFNHAVEKGITTINAMEESSFVFSDSNGEFIYTDKDKFPIDVNLFHKSFDLEKLGKIGKSRVGCYNIDGSIGSRTAYLSIPYADINESYGTSYYSSKRLEDLVMKAHRADFQLALHAVGDRAIDMALDALEKALLAYPNLNHRHRIEHFELPSQSALQKASRLGVVVSMIPNVVDIWSKGGAAYDVRLGGKRLETNNPFRDILNHGIIVAAGSDSDITEMDPFRGIGAIVHTDNRYRRVSIIEAIRMFTIDAAYANFEENIKGSIEKSKLADLIVLDRNPLEADPGDISKIKVIETVKNGKSIYRRGEYHEQA